MQPLQCDLQPQLQEPHRTTPQEQPLVAKHIEGTNRVRNDRSRTRRTHEVPFIVACSHFTRKNTRCRAPASPQNIDHATFMQPLQCDLQPKLQETHRTTPQEQPLVAKHIEGTNRVRNDRSRTRRTHEVPFIVACSHFTRKTTRFRAPASSPTHHFPSSPLHIVTTSHRHHFPSSPFPFIITSLRHHLPSSPLPFVTTSHRHHFPSSPPRHCHHPSSRSIPPLLILVLCIVMFCIVMWSTTLHQGQFHRLLFFCCVLLCYVLLCDLPPFIKVNSTACYSFVVNCYAMYCYVIYHPSSRSIPPLLILLLCIVMLCIVRSRTTLHHSQFHQVKVIRNSEVLLPNFLWWTNPQLTG